MPKAKNPLSAEEQRKRFEAEVERLIAAGELDPAEATKKVDKLIGNVARTSENR
jgi:hypothetical protein